MRASSDWAKIDVTYLDTVYINWLSDYHQYLLNWAPPTHGLSRLYWSPDTWPNRASSMMDAKFWWRPGPADNGRALQMTTGRTHFAKDCRARQSTPRTAVLLRFGRFALASLLTLPGTDLTAVPQGPAVRPGRLGTLTTTSGPSGPTPRTDGLDGSEYWGWGASQEVRTD